MNLFFRKAIAALTILGGAFAFSTPAFATTLSDQPLFTPIPVPGNLLLTLSVEYPTVDGPAYPTTSAFSSTTTYVGYFDPNKCYIYHYNSSNIQSAYFAPYSISTTSPATCTSSATYTPGTAISISNIALWSGNFLNWAMASAIDPFRWALTGGYRSRLPSTVVTSSGLSASPTTINAGSGDTAPGSSSPGITILERAWEDSQAQQSNPSSSGDDFPDHIITGSSFSAASALIASVTPFKNIGCLAIRSARLGNLVYFMTSVKTASSSTNNSCPGLPASGNFDNSSYYGDANGTSSSNTNPSGTCYGVNNSSSSCSPSSSGNPVLKNTAQPSQPSYSGSAVPSGVVQFSGGTYTGSSSNYSSSACANSSSSSLPNVCAGSGSSSDPGTIYELAARVQVCDPTLGGTVSANTSNLESNCVAYTPVSTSSTSFDYKPQGLMQSYDTSVDYGVVGYLNDPGNARDGGVLRANMKFIGPQIPVPGGSSIANPNVEWNNTTGVYIQDPGSPTGGVNTSTGAAASGTTPSGDAQATNAACAKISSSASNCVSYSGVLNYLNGFGESAHSYKSADNVGELYYTGIRYYKNLGNVPNWTDFSAQDAATSASTVESYTDGFPVITNWNDPIQYACQSNFILGIGDVNTHADGDTPNNKTFNGDSNETSWTKTAPSGTKAESAYVNTDPVNTQLATDAAGFMENNDPNDGGLSITTSGGGLGDTAVSWCCRDGNTFDMAGLAYDAHVTDMRPSSFTNILNADGSKTYPQTVSTFWLDVDEYQTFYYQNQFWLAAKYGGFTVPKNYSEYGTAGTLPSPIGTASRSNHSVAPSSLPSTTGASSLPSLSESSWYTTTRTQNGHLLPDNYFPANNATAMVSGLTTAFANISSQSGATTTAFATVSPKVTINGTVSYAASYAAVVWTGDLVASQLCFNGTGTSLIACPQTPPPAGWDGQSTLDANAAASSGAGWQNRVIITNNKAPSSNASAAAGVLLSNLTNSVSIAALNGYCPDKSATNCIQYLSGSRSNEGSAGDGTYRVRQHLLGDIVDSQADPVGPPNQSYSNTFNPGYSSFVAAHASRPTIVYIGANDGMLHAFDGSVRDGKNGLEYFAYMPSFGFQGPGSGSPSPSASAYAPTPGVNGLPSYGAGTYSTNHHFFVDASPFATDVDFANTSTSVGGSGNWHSVLIGGLGKGGAGYYALDVTDPTGADTSSPGPVAYQTSTTPNSTNANPGKLLLWEFTDPDEGFSYGDPTIVKTKKYGWVALLPSGYDNPSGVAKLYVVDVSNGTLLETISTANTADTNAVIGSPGSPAGLAWISAFVANYADYTTDYVYGGDQFGQIWRFDLTGTTPPPSCSAAGGCPVLLATLKDSSGNRQPVTSRLLIGVDPSSNNRYVLVGTGQELSKYDLGSTSQQSFYVIQDGTSIAPFSSVALTDGCSGSATSSANMIPCGGILGNGLPDETSNFTPSSGGTPKTNAPVTTTAGFFINLNSGYRVVTTPTIDGNVVAFSANLPSVTVCEASGTNQTYALAFAGPLVGTTLLTNPQTGAPLPYATGAGQAVNINIVNVQGTETNNGTTTNVSAVTLMVGTDLAGITTPPGSFAGSPTFKLLNWQEVNPSN